ncbi:XTP/dITP diphosphatase [Thermoplasma sp.]|uniref:XTP/dITP diphosphatase n=1 Tax=Thermoplasma sp. TaxID=1973142 RepID=UPI0012731E19|nr:XTP/dITP diphosphatase [Thermoplasma sp.]KAA8922777.1 MAG: XTP/dITP diphosphatase [Thermoplasma sp.]
MFKFVTSNQHKFEEVSRLASSYGIDIEWVRMKYEEIQDESTERISYDSCKKLAGVVEAPYFVDDSGLFINALKGFPGPFSSYVSSTIGNEGLLKIMEGVEDRSAYFLTVVSLNEGHSIMQFTGKVMGRIATSIRGSNGFGYDPVFIPDGSNMTFAEMDLETKNAISHRSIAFRGLFEYIKMNHSVKK